MRGSLLAVSKDQRFLFECNLYLRSMRIKRETFLVFLLCLMTVTVIVTVTVPVTVKPYPKSFG